MVTQKITLDNPERFAEVREIPKAKLEAAAKAACAKLKTLAEKYGLGFPGTCSVNHKYVCKENNNWEGGMYTGCYWLAYELTGDEFFKEVHRHVVHFMLNHLPEDCIPYGDYDFVGGEQPRDSSAACISACGLDEMCRHLPDDDPDKAIFQSAGSLPQIRLALLMPTTAAR